MILTHHPGRCHVASDYAQVGSLATVQDVGSVSSVNPPSLKTVVAVGGKGQRARRYLGHAAGYPPERDHAAPW
jgi:hypothetical protein